MQSNLPGAAAGLFLFVAAVAACDSETVPDPARGHAPSAVSPPMSAADAGAALRYAPSAGARRSGAARLVGEPAPPLRIAHWVKGDRPVPSLVASRGKVVVLYAFQGW